MISSMGLLLEDFWQDPTELSIVGITVWSACISAVPYGYNLFLERFQLESRIRIFTGRTVRLWNLLPREVVDCPTLDSFKTQLDNVLGRFISATISPRNIGPDEPWEPFQPGILWFYDLLYTEVLVHSVSFLKLMYMASDFFFLSCVFSIL